MPFGSKALLSKLFISSNIGSNIFQSVDLTSPADENPMSFANLAYQ